MQLKISRSTGNYLVLNLKGAVLTHFTAAGEVGIQLVDGKEGDDQFRKFLAQVMEGEGAPVALSPAAASRIEQLEEDNALLRQKVAALSEQIDGFAREKPITELKSCVTAPIAVDVLETNVPRAGRVSAEHIFAGKSRPWLEGFAACRWWRLELNDCDKRGDPQVPVEPSNPYPRSNSTQEQRVFWAQGWRECCRYLLDEMPDPTYRLEKAEG